MESLNQQTISNIEDFECPICYLLISRPTITSCKHLFCYSCINKILELEKKCPICRGNLEIFESKIDSILQKKIKNLFPKDFEIREKTHEEQDKLMAKIIRKRILYGNTHSIIADGKPLRRDPQIKNNHKWKVFLKVDGKEPSNKYIKKVTYEMDETFGGIELKFLKEPYEVERIGWGTFEIPIKIYWQKWLKKEPSQFSHYLSFDENGKTKSFYLEFDRELTSQNWKY